MYKNFETEPLKRKVIWRMFQKQGVKMDTDLTFSG